MRVLIDTDVELYPQTTLLFGDEIAFPSVPHGYSIDTRAIGNRVLLAIMAMGNLRERLARVSGWHARESGPAGTVGDFCTECGHRWPCDTRRMADGVYADPDTEG